jgi:protein TonB
MSNQQNQRYSAATLSPLSSSAVLGVLYPSQERAARLESARTVRVSSRPRMGIAFAPEAIWGTYNNYRSNGLVGSAVVHVAILALILGSGALFSHQVAVAVKPHETVTLIAPSLDSYALPIAKKIASGGGGGGAHDPLPAPKGRLPKVAMQQIVPPQIVMRREQPKLAVEATVVIPPQVHLADNHMPNLGVPTAAPLPSAPPSSGTGSGGGIGSGSGGGVGVGHGAGVGPGSGGGIGGGVFKVGGGISAPTALSTPDPEYTEEARLAKTQGTCILWLIVDDQGRPRNIRVVRGLGFGLDAKAISAVQQWRFQPSMKDGRPVNVQISVEVGFRLY